MTYFAELSAYEYGTAPEGAVVQNVGWLAGNIPFQTGTANDELLQRLWQFCTVSVVQTRGLHICEICGSKAANDAERNGHRLLLGSAEIRVISEKGVVYAAPNLIYHYVHAHNYLPPAEFVEAVLAGLSPPDSTYFERLNNLGEQWIPTSQPTEGAKWFRFVKTPKGVIRVEEP